MIKENLLTELALLIAKYKATIFYTTDDNGIHIEADGEEVFVGFLHDECAETILLNERMKHD
jgi:hypothetical protein